MKERAMEFILGFIVGIIVGLASCKDKDEEGY
jgi:uncharacterized membrane protein YccC